MVLAIDSAARVPEEIVSELEMCGVAPDSYDFVPLTAIRKLIARRMLQSAQEVPHFALDMRVEMDALLAFKAERDAGGEARVSVNDLLIKAAALALMAVPEVNTSFTPRGIARHKHADIAFAVAMEGGIVTPIVRGAEDKPLAVIAAEARDLADRGRCKRLKPEEYTGGTFTISNLGMLGVSRFGAIINQPQAAILSVGSTEAVYLVEPEGPRAARVMTVTLTSDHRAIDGAVAARWLKFFKTLVEKPATLGA
jgi:pyruvate dehydrogenase E2 component (dihydrolipoamide acetyltransferase)